MRTYLIAGFSSIVLGTSLANGDALLLLSNTRMAEEDAPKKVATVEYDTGMYVRTEIGANLMTNVNVKSVNGNWKMDPGIDIGASFGYRFTKIIGLEVQTGFTWNAFNSYEQVKVANTVGGQLYQVPIVMNFVVTIPLSEGNYEPLFGRGAELVLLGGGGGEWGSATGSADGTEVFTLNDWTYRYQAGTVLNAYLAPQTKFGVYFRYSRTGDFTGNTPGGADYKLAAVNNFAVGIDFSIRF